MYNSFQDLQKRMEELERKVATMEHGNRHTMTMTLGQVLGGNTLTFTGASFGTIYGVKYSATEIESVPTEYTLSSSSSDWPYADGIGVVSMLWPSRVSTQLAFVVNDTRNAIGYPLVQNSIVALCSQAVIPIDAGGSMTAWTFIPAG
jgi:hypothetical protein